MASIAMVALLGAGFSTPAGAASEHGHVIGELRLSPGTVETTAVAKAGLPIAGRVVFKSATGREIIVGVGKSGEFTLNLHVGTYTAFGGSPGWFPNCRFNAGKPFAVVAGGTVKVAVWCIEE
jgi:hypothetical protein